MICFNKKYSSRHFDCKIQTSNAQCSTSVLVKTPFNKTYPACKINRIVSYSTLYVIKRLLGVDIVHVGKQ